MQCEQCGKDVWIIPSKLKFKNHFCDTTCKNNWLKVNVPKSKNSPIYKQVEINCDYCGVQYTVPPFEIERSTHHFCCREHKYLHTKEKELRVGENNHNYKGGEVKLNCVWCGEEFNKERKSYNVAKNKGIENTLACCKEHAYLYRRKITREKEELRLIEENGFIPRVSDYGLLLEWTKEIFKRDNYTCTVCGAKRGSKHGHHLHSYLAHPELRYDVNNGVLMCKDCHREFHTIYGSKKFTKDDYYKFKEIKQNEGILV